MVRKPPPSSEIDWKTLLGPIVRATGLLNPDKLSQPQTLMHNLRRSVEEGLQRAFDSIPEDQQRTMLISLFEEMTSSEGEQSTREFIVEAKAEVLRTLRSRQGGRSLLRLYGDLDKATPGSPMALQGDFDSAVHIRRMIEPSDLILDIAHFRGERRARLAIRTLQSVAEPLYDSYLRHLWLASGMLQGKRRKHADQSLGSLVRALSQELRAYPGLIDDRVALLRNSAAHGRWEYDPVGRHLLMSDTKQRAPLQLTVRELIRIIERMFQAAGPGLQKVFNYWALVGQERMGLLESQAQIIALLREQDPAVQAGLSKAFEAERQGRMAALLKPTLDLPRS